MFSTQILRNALTVPTPELKIMNLYDFDGVLADPLEEALFQMPTTEHDAEFIRVVSRDLNLDLSQESLTSQRYICIQAIMWAHEMPILPGKVVPQDEHPFYILTARSDIYAVRRMHEFITESYWKEPIKTQHLDHLPKGIAIELLLQRHPDTHFRFFDDNPRHIQSAQLLRSDRLEIFHVDNQLASRYEEAQSFYRNAILELAL